jgi:uncharacterized protein (TIGR02118 family)
MVKLIALYKKPEDLETFEKHYFEVHMPLVAKIPNLIRSEVAKLSSFGQSGESGAKYFMITEMYFENMDKLNEGMASHEGKAAGKDLMGFAKNYVEMIIGKVRADS